MGKLSKKQKTLTIEKDSDDSEDESEAHLDIRSQFNRQFDAVKIKDLDEMSSPSNSYIN